MSTNDPLQEATKAAYRAYAKAVMVQFHEAISKLTEELKTRDPTPQEVRALRKILNVLCKNPPLPPEDGIAEKQP
ncbi:MAG TPA: hypothetical protein VMW46_03270 [Candidatus Desulfaltia sp.]|nr:hypothetical protein [Candidatus Desulfaltia sp.]